MKNPLMKTQDIPFGNKSVIHKPITSLPPVVTDKGKR